tara:strand:- start:11239 stop:11769 length:531 start_codon:yes stop_codon:yes gene_type:complete
MKKKILIAPYIFFLLILFVFFYLLLIDRNPSHIPSNLINKKIPLFKTEILLQKGKFNSQEEFGGEIILVNFFATWCKPCRDEHAYIKSLSEKLGVKIIGINYKDNPKKTVRWLEKMGNPYSKIPIDKNGKIAIDWGVYGIPETFIVNPKKIIVYRHAGPITKKDYKKITLLIEKNR